MKFMMIFEGVDRATKVMNKIMSAEKKVAASSKASARSAENAADRAARATQKQASALSRIGSVARSAYGAVVAGAQAAARATAKLHAETIKLARSGLGQVGSGARKAMHGLTIAAGIATAAVGSSALAAGQLLDTATQFESFNIQLETLEGSAAKGQKALAWITQFAIDTPLELDQVVESYRNLKTFGLDPTNGTLQALVDTMAASGKGVEQLEGLTLALGQAWTKQKLQGEEALQLLERGVPVWDILSQKYGKTAAELQDMASKGKLGREAIQYLIDEIGRRNAGASEKMARTWNGMIGNLSDVWTQFKLAIMNAGLFDWMKGRLQGVLDTINQMKTDGTLDQWAQTISSRIVFVLDSAWQFGTRVWEIMKTLGGYLKTAADYVGGWENLALVLAGIAFAPTLIGTAAGLVQIALGLSMLGAALMANPIILAIAAIVAGAAAIYMNWGSIKAFFVDLWSSIAAAAQSAWATITSWLGFDPIAALSTGWSMVSAFFANAWQSIPVIDWSQYLPDFSWPQLPTFEWPEIPDLSLPELPDIAGWIGAFSDKAMAAIEGVSARLGNAWGRLRSAFSFGQSSAEVTVTDPATIQAAAAATSALQANMQAVAAIDTGPAMNRLAALEAAARRVRDGVTASVRQAEAFLAGISFYNQGAALMDTMAAGIRARAAVVVSEIQKMAQTIRDHLPSSPAKVGPLSDIHRLKFGETIAGSIRAEPMVKAMRSAAAATMAAAAIGAPSMAGAGAPPAVDAARNTAARAAVARASVQTQAAMPSSSEVTVNLNGPLKLEGPINSELDLEKALDRALSKSVRKVADLVDEENRRRSRKTF